jgi:hypothetical protein
MTWKDLVEQIVNMPSLEEAWRNIEYQDVGSVEACYKLMQLIEGSEHHRKCLGEETNGLMNEFAGFMEWMSNVTKKPPLPEEIHDRTQALCGEVRRTQSLLASVYLLYGMMLGLSASGNIGRAEDKATWVM